MIGINPIAASDSVRERGLRQMNAGKLVVAPFVAVACASLAGPAVPAVLAAKPAAAKHKAAPGAKDPGRKPAAAGERTDYPPCGPYVNEGTSFICKFEQLHLDLEGVGAFSKCRFGDDSSACQGVATNGLFPWGRTFASRGRPKVKIAWGWNGSSRDLTVITYRDDQGATGVANLTGTVPNAGSPRFTVTEAFAQSGDGYPNGNHFYTPNLPGQGPGEPGGPLAINFQNGTGTDWGAVADIWGYLYLKR